MNEYNYGNNSNNRASQDRVPNYMLNNFEVNYPYGGGGGVGGIP